MRLHSPQDSFEDIFGGKTIKNYIPKQIRELGIYNMSQLSDDFFIGITDEILKRAEKYEGLKRYQVDELIEKCVKISLDVIEYGWDKQYGGIFYFLDRKGYPQQQLEWDQKLWWVHLESAICMLKGYQLTGNEKCLDWFKKLHEYMWKNFKDSEYPEWFGYLNRRGEVLLPLKGGKWKGCFHVPRGLYQLWQILETL